MDSQVMGVVDYLIVDDEARTLITFTFAHLDRHTHITIVHDRACEGTDIYTLQRHEPTLMLSANAREVFVLNVCHGPDMIANGIYQVDTGGDEDVLRQVCGCGLKLRQDGRLYCEWDSPQFAMD
jgi:hypothetical protein